MSRSKVPVRSRSEVRAAACRAGDVGRAHEGSPAVARALEEMERARVEAAIERHAVLSTLFDNGWVALAVLDPETGCSWRRDRNGTWLQALPEQPPEVTSESGALASATPIPA